MVYAIIQPPFTLQFREMSKKELKSYFEWFQGVQQERLKELILAVHDTPDYEAWEANFMPISLDLLGNWFAMQIETRQRTQEEVDEIGGRSSFSIEIPLEELTNRTFSLAMDVAIYFSHVLLRNHPGLHWDQPLGSKKHVDYGQPVIAGFGSLQFNPVRMLVTRAYKIASETRAENTLCDLYDIWTKMIPVVGH